VFVVLLAIGAAGCLDSGDADEGDDASPASVDEANQTIEDDSNGSNGGAQPTQAPNRTEPDASDTSADEASSSGEAVALQVHELSFDGPEVDRTISISGNFARNETCVPAGCPRSTAQDGDPVHHEVPLDPSCRPTFRCA